jgi:antitoxin component YwqK of YwqJK toxin-antitoxin module
MKENQKIINYPSRNIQTETYIEGDTFVTKHFYDGKDAYVKEFIYLTDGIKKIKYFNINGVQTKLDHFVEDKRQGEEIKYFVSKAGAMKSSKIYDNGKLHGANITYNEAGQIIKHEVFAGGKCVLKYFRKDDETNDISNVVILDKANVENLPKDEYEKLQTLMANNPESFVE